MRRAGITHDGSKNNTRIFWKCLRILYFKDLVSWICLIINNISKVNFRTNVKPQNQSSSVSLPVLEPDPCSLIRSFVNNPPRGRISPNDVFLLWRISNGSRSNFEAARAVIGAYGETMSQSNSEWLNRLRCLFDELTDLETIMPHSGRYSSSTQIKDSTVARQKNESWN